MTGLVLEGGAMRGLFTAGVLDVMMENGIALEYVQSSYRGDRYTFHVEMSR